MLNHGCPLTPGPGVRSWFASLALLLFASPLISQEVLWQWQADWSGDRFGRSVDRAGDVNQDGYSDVIVGAPQKFDLGAAYVYSGKDGTVLFTFSEGPWGEEWFGFSVGGAGDVNGDGVVDFIVGAPYDSINAVWSGSARVFSGKDGSQLHLLLGAPSVGAEFGLSVAGAGDVDLDGFADLIVGARYDGSSGLSAGSARVFSGLDGSELHVFYGNSHDALGASVSAAGDVDGDGVADLLVGAHQFSYSGAGYAMVYSGYDGSILRTFNGDQGYDHFGYSVSGASDVDGDGVADFIIGAPTTDFAASDSGSAYVYSGRNGTMLFRFDGDGPDDQLGWSVDHAGDVNGDGTPDLVAGAPQWSRDGPGGYARILSGATGSCLFVVKSESVNELFGIAVSSAGDVNADGLDEVVVGAPYYSAQEGQATVFSGNDLFLTADPDTVAAGDTLTLTTREGTPGNVAALFLTEVSGAPVFLRLAIGRFAADRAFVVSGTVPPGYLGLARFRSLALGPSGKVVDSLDEEVVFQ